MGMTKEINHELTRINTNTKKRLLRCARNDKVGVDGLFDPFRVGCGSDSLPRVSLRSHGAIILNPYGIFIRPLPRLGYQMMGTQ